MKKYIQAIMTTPIGSRMSFKHIIPVTAVFITLTIPILIGLSNIPTGQAQSLIASKPIFEVASVKFADKCGNEYSPQPGMRTAISTGHSFNPGGTYSTCASLRFIIMDAYGIEFPTLPSGGPDWSNSALYKIDAKAENNATKEQVRLMIQSLLEERFKLKIHRENRESPVYFLVAAKGGHKLQPIKDEQDKKPLEGSVSFPVGGNPGPVEFNLRAITMDRFASQLTSMAGRRVINKTGIAGFYDISLHFTMDPQMGGGIIRMAPVESQGGPTPAVEAPSGPTIFTALQEQLGLKLEADKAPLEYFIIDSIEKPSEN
jgi:bla regulator protein blaR1